MGPAVLRWKMCHAWPAMLAHGLSWSQQAGSPSPKIAKTELSCEASPNPWITQQDLDPQEILAMRIYIYIYNLDSTAPAA